MTENPDPIERTLELLLYAPLGIGLFLKETAPQFVDMFVSRGRAEIDRRHEEVQQRVTTARSLGQVALAFGPPIIRERVSQTVADARQRAEHLFGAAEPDPAPAPLPNGSNRAPAAEPAPTSAPSAPLPPAPAAPPSTATGWGTRAPTPPVPAPPVSAPTAPPSFAAPPIGTRPPPITFSASRAAVTDARPVVNAGDIESNDDLPIPGYDALSASQVVERLLGLPRSELDTVYKYESSHRQRRTILGKIEQLLG